MQVRVIRLRRSMMTTQSRIVIGKEQPSIVAEGAFAHYRGTDENDQVRYTLVDHTDLPRVLRLSQRLAVLVEIEKREELWWSSPVLTFNEKGGAYIVHTERSIYQVQILDVAGPGRRTGSAPVRQGLTRQTGSFPVFHPDDKDPPA